MEKLSDYRVSRFYLNINTDLYQSDIITFRFISIQIIVISFKTLVMVGPVFFFYIIFIDIKIFTFYNVDVFLRKYFLNF